MPQYRLHYFNSRGRAELIRLILKLSGVEFEDIRYNRETEWPAVKDSMPFGQIPVLEIDGKKLPQSNTIARYLANEYKLVGNDKWESAQADMIVDSMNDLLPNVRPILLETDEEKREALGKQFVVENVFPFLQRLEKLHKENGKEYLASNTLTWADLTFFTFLDFVVERSSVDIIFAQTPELKVLFEKVANIPAIKNWVSTRPATAR